MVVALETEMLDALRYVGPKNGGIGCRAPENREAKRIRNQFAPQNYLTNFKIYIDHTVFQSFTASPPARQESIDVMARGVILRALEEKLGGCHAFADSRRWGLFMCVSCVG